VEEAVVEQEVQQYLFVLHARPDVCALSQRRLQEAQDSVEHFILLIEARAALQDRPLFDHLAQTRHEVLWTE